MGIQKNCIIVYLTHLTIYYLLHDIKNNIF